MIYTQLSDWTLTSKPTDPTEKARISGEAHFHYRELSEEHFLQALQAGHGFCPLSRDQAQADTSHTNIIVYDFDHSTIPLPAFVEGLALKPSYTYYSYSNGKDGQFRFRLIYQLYTPIEGSQYDAAHQYIAQANGWKPATKDDQTNKYDPLARNQYFFSGTSISYYPDNIIEYNTHTQPKPAQAPTAKRVKKARQTKPQADTPTTAYFTEEFKRNYGRLTPHAYTQLTAEGSVYYMTHTPLPEVDSNTPIIEYPKGYVETPRRLWWDSENHAYFVKKWEDGEARHRKIYMASIIIRRLNPQLSPDELLFAVCQEFATYYSNDDKKYTTADLIRIVERVLSADMGRELGKWRRKNYIVNGSYCEKHGTSKRAIVGAENGKRNAAERAKRYEQIAEHYDPDKTDAQNLLRLKQKGIQCSQRTLTSYKQAYGYTTPKDGTAQAPKPKAKPTPKPQHPRRETPKADQAPHQPTMQPNYTFDVAGYKDRIKDILRGVK